MKTDRTLCGILYWLKAGNHTEQTAGEKKCPNEGTCNAYLKDVFRFYLFIEAEYEQYGSLKTLSYNQIIAVNQVGVKRYCGIILLKPI